jgi:hypothetical protein
MKELNCNQVTYIHVNNFCQYQVNHLRLVQKPKMNAFQ